MLARTPPTVSFPAWCCTEIRHPRSKRAFCLVLSAILCSSLEAQRRFPILFKRSLPLFSHSLLYIIQPCFQEEDHNCESAPPHPPSTSSLSPSYCTGDDNTPILPWPHALFIFPPLIFSSCSLFCPFLLSSITTFSLPLKRNVCRIVLCCDIENCIH